MGRPKKFTKVVSFRVMDHMLENAQFLGTPPRTLFEMGLIIALRLKRTGYLSEDAIKANPFQWGDDAECERVSRILFDALEKAGWGDPTIPQPGPGDDNSLDDLF